MDIIELRNKLNDLNLLYVEDEEIVRKEVAYFLKKFFKNVDIAKNGR